MGEIEVWETRDQETRVIETLSLDDATASVELNMSVTDGYMLTFSVTNGDGKEVVAENIDVSELVPWGMEFRFGLTAKGDTLDQVNFTEFNSINF